jgi:short-subunit dehydrogenase
MKKIILITGISSGFGKEMSKLLSSKGHVVYGTIRSKCDVAEGVKTLNVELAHPESIYNAVETVIKNEGRIDVLINNAGMHSGGSLEDSPIEIYEMQMKVNYYGWVHMIKAVLPHMRAQKSGTIINISSIGGITGIPFQGVYTASKFAIEGMSIALRMEVKAFNINVVVVNPGDFRTRNTETRQIVIPCNSAYKDQFARSLAIIEKDEQGGSDPALLAKKILKIVESRKPRQRYIVGLFEQKLAAKLKCYLPERFFDSLIAGHYGIKY